jgi:hypothetical protein
MAMERLLEEADQGFAVSDSLSRVLMERVQKERLGANGGG